MPTHIQADSRTRNFPYLCAVTQPPTAHFCPNPARFPPKIPAFAEIFRLFAQFRRKMRTVRPKMRRNSKAKAATMPTHIQNDSRTRNFPYLCAATQPPAARFRPISAENSAFAEIFGFFARFCRKKRVALPLNKVAAVHTCAQSDSRARNFPYLCAATQPPAARFRPIPAENSAFVEIFGFFA